MTTADFAILDRPEVAAILFHPRQELAPADGGEAGRSVAVSVAEGIEVCGRLFPSEPKAPVVLFFHGNGEIAAEYAGIASLYRQLGLTLLVMDYRGYGASGGMPTAGALLADAWTTYEMMPSLLADHELADSPLFVMGRSLGSAAAIEIAARAGKGIAGLILESGFAETLALVARLGGRLPVDADETRNGFGNLEKIAKVTTPTLVLHGENDWIIPVDDGRALHGACGAVEKTLLTIPGAGHNDLLMVGLSDYFHAIQAFVERRA